ncbi:thymidylate synthase [Rhodococcus phage RGL3]|uniref:Thymidylate synthase n=1 Tax=Rhodococcus phage RGL3 TaxID=2922221 RepID=G9FHM5_9CAUD|nr:thymidylate synthase [Rhodococcus phage RGL3]AEV52113.1 thymidylate synthase [Rhodococcus phage RGL3]
MSIAMLIAHTEINRHALAEIGYEPHGYRDPFARMAGRDETDADELAEFAGRLCYLSFNRPNPATATNADYLAHIHEVGHESVEEHASASFYVEASRSVLTELERHRSLSFSVVSQRYVDIPKKFPMLHTPPAFAKITDQGLWDSLDEVADMAEQVYYAVVEHLEGQGLPRKEAREAARAVLPNSTNSPMVVTGNMRAWKHVIRLRHHEAADAEIRELAGEVLWQLREIAPNTFADIAEEPATY